MPSATTTAAVDLVSADTDLALRWLDEAALLRARTSPVGSLVDLEVARHLEAAAAALINRATDIAYALEGPCPDADLAEQAEEELLELQDEARSEMRAAWADARADRFAEASQPGCL